MKWFFKKLGLIPKSKGGDDGGAAEIARQEALKLENDRAAAEQASGSRRARRRGLLSAARLGTNGDKTLGSTQV